MWAVKYIVDCFKFAYHGSAGIWDSAWIGLIGGVIGGFCFWALGLKMPHFLQSISENPLAGPAIGFALCAAAGVVIVFLVRLIYAPLHFAFEKRGGLLPLLRSRLGTKMGPVIMMAAGVAAFVLLFGGGAIWFILSNNAQQPAIEMVDLAPHIEKAISQPKPAESEEQKQAIIIGTISARLVWTQGEYTKFQQMAEEYRRAGQQLLDVYKVQPPPLGRSFDVSRMQVMMTGGPIEALAAKDLNLQISLQTHRSFDNNPEQSVPGDDVIQDPARKYEYRKFYSQYADAQQTLDSVGLRFKDAISQMNAQIGGWATQGNRPIAAPR